MCSFNKLWIGPCQLCFWAAAKDRSCSSPIHVCAFLRHPLRMTSTWLSLLHVKIRKLPGPYKHPRGPSGDFGTKQPLLLFACFFMMNWALVQVHTRVAKSYHPFHLPLWIDFERQGLHYLRQPPKGYTTLGSLKIQVLTLSELAHKHIKAREGNPLFPIKLLLNEKMLLKWISTESETPTFGT